MQNELNLIKNNRIILGLETEVESANTSYLSNSSWGPYLSEFTEQSLRTTGIFIQDQFSIGEKLNGAIGFRYDNNEKFGGQSTFRIAPSYYISETGTKIKATYGTGFKAPSLYYLFDPMYGNPNLKPEKSLGWDAGIEQFFLNFRLSMGVTLFQIKFEDMFGIDANYKTINLNKAESNGVEAFVNYAEPELWSVKLNYTYTFAVDKSEGSAEKDLLLLRRPMHKGTLELGYKLFARFNLNSSIIYVGERADKDFTSWPGARVKLADYMLVNLSASYRLADYISISARLDNIFDKYYEDILYYGTMGRNFSVGINLNY
jgi:vitamin B12 transporter